MPAGLLELQRSKGPAKGHGVCIPQMQEEDGSDFSDGESKMSIKSVNSVNCEECLLVSNNSVKLVSERSQKGRDLKSGFLEKPKSHVLVKQKWPHMNQNPQYVMEPLTFNQLSFQQFVGGECHTIL